MSCERAEKLDGPAVPNLHPRVTVSTGGGEARPIGTERDAIDPARMPLENERGLIRARRVAEVLRRVFAATGDKRHSEDEREEFRASQRSSVSTAHDT